MDVGQWKWTFEERLKHFVCVWVEMGGFAGNYVTVWTVVSVRKKRWTAMLGTWDVGEDGGGLACVICEIYEFCLGQEDQWWMIKKLKKWRSCWQPFPTLVRSLEMKASALHQLLGNRTGVKQFHSCKKKQTTVGQCSLYSAESSRENAIFRAVPRGQWLSVMLKEYSNYYINTFCSKVEGSREKGPDSSVP